MKRRQFVNKSATAAGVVITAPAFVNNMITRSPNERINIALAGISGDRVKVRGMINGRGIVHINNYSKIPNVTITTICDVDERLFPGVVSTVEKLFGTKPKTEIDFRNILDDKDIDVVSVATPDHWHALMTVWACQAGKDVYVEKPVSHNVSEGRKMVQAARKYNRIVQSGICYRSSKAVKEGIKFVHDGNLGKIYMAKGITYRYRVPIEHVPDSPVPQGVHWDLFLGPAPWRPFNENRYIYQWHWYWDTGTTEFGNNGIYRMDTVRWALNKNTHPVKIHCLGGKYGRDDDQEVPNILVAGYEYDDGTIIQNEVRSLPTNPEGLSDSGDCFLYSDQGWITFSGNGYKTYFGQKNEPGPAKSENDFPPEERSNGWDNFIACVRSRKREDLDNEIIEGHLSASLGHLGVISCRTGRKLIFNPETEKFVGDKEADKLLTRVYRKPYVMPDNV
ncbi:MAG TPA: gfo/Idh/MocA family oxidoreductase [Bacteroidales bacterium]|nr:gfo/Idh/MocA family oxidoreductase [Bacteroidales bacterium]